MKWTTARVGTAREFFERGRKYAHRARAGKRLPESHLVTFEDQGDRSQLFLPGDPARHGKIRIEAAQI